MHILLTRPLEDCYEMILKFQSLGHQVSHLPLIRIEKVNYEEINFSEYNRPIYPRAYAYCQTSANFQKKPNVSFFWAQPGNFYITVIVRNP